LEAEGWRLEGWKAGRLERWKLRAGGWKAGSWRLEGWKAGRLEAGRLEGWKNNKK